MIAPTPYYQDAAVTLYCADVLDGLKQMADQSVQCAVTSPPYWGLRDYKIDGQLGLEATPEAYTEKLTTIFQEVRRVLSNDGTLWLNLGDCYHRGDRGGYRNDAHRWEKSDLQRGNRGNGETIRPNRLVQAGLKDKDLVGIPWRVAFALQADGWWLRSDIIWSKPNPMPESVRDRPTRSHEYVFLFSASQAYFYDADAIKEPGISAGPNGPGTQNNVTGQGFARRSPEQERHRQDKQRGHSRRHAGFNDRWDAMSHDEQCSVMRNKRSVWTIATQPYPEAHFATFPKALVEPCILAGSRPGDVVLDPFCGSGTTLTVARRLGRKAIGIDLNPDYCALVVPRLAQEVLALS